MLNTSFINVNYASREITALVRTNEHGNQRPIRIVGVLNSVNADGNCFFKKVRIYGTEFNEDIRCHDSLYISLEDILMIFDKIICE